jgi:hypothetical protein
MSKTKISEYSETASANTDIGGINIAEGMAPSDVNNAMREQMAQLKKFLDGSSGDTLTSAKIVATTAEIGAATFGDAVIMSSDVTLRAQSDIRFADSDSSNYVAFKPPQQFLAMSLGRCLLRTVRTGQVLSTNGSGALSFTTAAAGDVVGPASSTDNAVVRFDSTTGKLIKNSTVIMDNSGNTSFGDAFVQRATLKDYAVEGSAIGNAGATRTLDLENANFFSATLDQACDFTFSNPPGSGDFGAFVLELTNGGAFAITWPAAVDWPGGTAPTLTAAGVDQLVFTTRDAGTTWLGFVAGLDIKSP